MTSGQKWIYGWGIKRELVGLEGSILRHTELPKVFGNHTDTEIFATVKGGVVNVYYTAQVQQARERFGRGFLRSQYITKVLTASGRSRNNFKRFLATLGTLKFRQLPSAELSLLLKGFFRRYLWVMTFFKLSNPEYLFPLEKQLKSVLHKHFKASLIQKYFEILTTPYKPDQISKERLEWLSAILRQQPKPAFNKNHINKYPWLVHNSPDLKKSIGELQRKFKKELSSEGLEYSRKELRDLLGRKKKIRDQQKGIFESAGTDGRLLEKLSRAACGFGVERLELKRYYGLEPVHVLLKEIARRMSISLKVLLCFYRYEDMQNFLLRNTRLSRRELEKRKLYMIIMLEKGRLTFKSGIPAKSLAQVLLKSSNVKASGRVSLAGRVAQSGKVIGTARVIDSKDSNDLTKIAKRFHKGDIIVASMTQPNLMFLIKKAAGIVTDEGGMVSHAAIVAREFKIPCIVGTKNATRVFKDGDRIEVDANKGIVRKI